MYQCNACHKPFNGFDVLGEMENCKSLLGYFDYHMERSYGVDDELYYYIINSNDAVSAKLAKQLAQTYADHYYSDERFYYAAVRSWQRANGGNVSASNPTRRIVGSKQGQISLVPQSNRVKLLISRCSRAKAAVRVARSNMEKAYARFKDDIELKDVLRFKANRNNKREQYFFGWGEKKIQSCINAGYHTVFQVRNAPCSSRSTGPITKEFKAVLTKQY